MHANRLDGNGRAPHCGAVSSVSRSRHDTYRRTQQAGAVEARFAIVRPEPCDPSPPADGRPVFRGVGARAFPMARNGCVPSRNDGSTISLYSMRLGARDSHSGVRFSRPDKVKSIRQRHPIETWMASARIAFARCILPAPSANLGTPVALIPMPSANTIICSGDQDRRRSEAL